MLFVKAIRPDNLILFDGPEGKVAVGLIVTLINYWVAELVKDDTFLLEGIVELLDILLKSSLFKEHLNNFHLLSNLIKASEQNIRFETRARLVKYINQLSGGDGSKLPASLSKPRPPSKLKTEPTQELKHFATDESLEPKNHSVNGYSDFQRDLDRVQNKTTEKKVAPMRNHDNYNSSDHEKSAQLHMSSSKKTTHRSNVEP
mmetsp:Transcript_31385/g.28567  ORF Transcript_31385/g.28567 Transcript_31385/m.28567 type:complete len:202 (+) Transcript_31385:910-1515(+)|eukprot:CAMPEP_0114575358 /NCGR_PEP_ID=MMETSP0125-20121206/238_1 /TAXON_ID=485358 ORGANISM="Aristerostoma sp., Strain ATCC 50986" /NCGR_SAMPLE_ID=MMETSP0125 /ASSEMBLY_ACC=CAM_ASM_000245 /LENGTH=201 /DNA_ID=CAMNT_0001763029 /DNA_START=814 /DNA_END=1419 /DNA_ORIENTATION=-